MLTVESDQVIVPFKVGISVLISFKEGDVAHVPHLIFFLIILVYAMNLLEIVQVIVFVFWPVFQEAAMVVADIVEMSFTPAEWSETMQVPTE